MAEKLKIAGLRLTIEGAAEFNRSISSINNELKVATANLAKTTAAFDKNTPAVERLAAKQQEYSAKLDAARKKGEEYARVLASVTAQYGENSDQAALAAATLARNEAEQIKLQKALENVTQELEAQQSAWMRVSEKAQATGEKISGIGDKLSNAGKALSVGITAPLIAAGFASFNMASDMDESLNKVDVAFGESSGLIKQFAETSLTSFGISKAAALDAAALFGDMGTAMGLTTAEAADMAMALVGLAGDLASFKNIDIEQANNALKGIFTGETESLKSLGIVMTETQLAAYALSKGITTKVAAMSQAEKVMLRYNFVLDASANAQGDFTRTSDGAANQMRIFTEGTKELAANIGENLLPIGTGLITKLNEIVKKFGSLSKEQQQNILKWAGIAAAAGPVLLVFGKISSGIGSAIKSFSKLSEGIAKAGGAMAYIGAHPVQAALAGFAALVTATFALNKAFEGMDAPMSNLSRAIRENRETVSSLRGEWDRLIATQNEAISSGLSEVDYLSALKAELDTVVDANGKIQQGYETRAAFITSELSKATGVEIAAVDGIIAGYNNLASAIEQAIVQKRAMIILDAKEETYTAAIQGLADLEEAHVTAYNNMAQAQADFDKYGGQVYAQKLAQTKKIYTETNSMLQESYAAIGEFESIQMEISAGNYDTVAGMVGYTAKSLEEITALTIEEGKKQLNATKQALTGQLVLYRDTGEKKYLLGVEQAGNELRSLVNHLQQMGVQVDVGTLQLLTEWEQYYGQQAAAQETAGNQSVSLTKRQMDGLVSAIASGTGMAESTARIMAQRVFDAANSKTSQFSIIGDAMMSGISSGIFAAIPGVSQVMQAAMNKTLNAGKSALDINSPSKVAAAELGEPISEGVAVGVERKAPVLNVSLRQMLSGALSSASRLRSIDMTSGLQGIADRLTASNAVTNNNAYSYDYGGVTVQNMVVRDDTDIKRIARELFDLQRATSRGQGVVMI